MIESTQVCEPTVATAIGNPADRTTREEMIRRRAYFRAQKRGFAPGHELQDWLLAEWEIDRLLASRRPQRRYGMSRKSR